MGLLSIASQLREKPKKPKKQKKQKKPKPTELTPDAVPLTTTIRFPSKFCEFWFLGFFGFLGFF